MLAVVKGNLAAPAPALAYTLETTRARGRDNESGAVRVVWQGEVGHTAAVLLARGGAAPDPAARDALLEAQDFLRVLLADGPRPAQAVLAAARGVGIAEKTLRRAKIALGVAAQHETFGAGGTWWWALPPHVATPGEHGHAPAHGVPTHPGPAPNPHPLLSRLPSPHS